MLISCDVLLAVFLFTFPFVHTFAVHLILPRINKNFSFTSRNIRVDLSDSRSVWPSEKLPHAAESSLLNFDFHHVFFFSFDIDL